jgi:hypothetical protein
MKTLCASLALLASALAAAAQSRPSEFYFLPIAQHETVAGGAVVTDLTVVNPQASWIVVSLYILPEGRDNSDYLTTSRSYAIPPWQSLALPDVVGSLWGFEGRATLVLAAPGEGTTDRRFIASARTHNLATPGTPGEGVAPTFVETPAGEQAILSGLTQSASSRAAIGVFNDSESASSVSIVVFGADGVARGDATVPLAPYARAELDLRGIAPADLDGGYAVVKPSGDAGMGLVSYGLVSAASSGAGAYFEGVPLVRGSSSATVQSSVRARVLSARGGKDLEKTR